MLIFDILTIFPRILDSYLKEGLIAKAQKKKLIKINVHNLRRWADNRLKKVDDRPYGGGLGMVLSVEPIVKALKSLAELKPKNKKLKIKERNSKIILFSPRGKEFNQKLAYKFSKLNRLIMICGRYEGVDERIRKNIADIELSIGSYDLMGGELAAMVVIETVSRLIPGVLGKEQLLKERITKEKGFIEYPQYTRPEIFSPQKGIFWRVPKVLLSGNHKKIEEWRKRKMKVIGN